MKKITLMADDDLIEAAHARASAMNTTLDAEFQVWLADYVDRERRAEKAKRTIRELQSRISTGGRKFTRDEMNER